MWIFLFTAQNQRLCCRLLPMIVNILQLATKQQNIVLPTTTLTSAIVSGNGRNLRCKCNRQCTTYLTDFTYSTSSQEGHMASTGIQLNQLLALFFASPQDMSILSRSFCCPQHQKKILPSIIIKSQSV